jgi:hypothetical protein
MAQTNSGIGNVTTNTGLVEMAMAYSRSRVLCAAALLGVADALGDEVRMIWIASRRANFNGLSAATRHPDKSPGDEPGLFSFIFAFGGRRVILA